MSIDWRKDDKKLYLPSAEPAIIGVPAMNFFAIDGEGDPNGPDFALAVEALYALSYAIKMSPKSKTVRAPAGYQPYRVYPLEGVWDLNEQGRQKQRAAGGALDKADLRYSLMIRQPDFVDAACAALVAQAVLQKKPGLRAKLERAAFTALREGDCAQLLHHGSFDSEPASFGRMQAFCQQAGWQRLDLTHREIYLSDPRRGSPETLRTVLRFRVQRTA